MSMAPCRAAVSSQCEIFTSSEDRTFDGDSVVCICCYAKLMPWSDSGRLLIGEIDETISRFRNGGKKPHRKPDPILDWLEGKFGTQ